MHILVDTKCIDYIKVSRSFNFCAAPCAVQPRSPHFFCCSLNGPISRIRGPPQQGSVSRLSTQLIMILRPNDEWSALIGWHCENTGTHFQRP